MANYTTNLNLIKPEPTDKYNVEDNNSNMDIIDTEIKKVSDNLTTQKNTVVYKTEKMLIPLWTLDSALNLYKYRIIEPTITPTSIVNVNIALNSLDAAMDAGIKSVSTSDVSFAWIYSEKVPTMHLYATVEVLNGTKSILEKEV